MPTVQSNGISMYYETHGTGEPLLPIQGLATDLTQVEGITRELSLRCQVVAFDNRGAGRTDRPDQPYSIEMMAEDAAGLVAGLGLKMVNVLGMSMGGRIAIALTLNHPEMVKSLILVSTSARVNHPRGLAWAFGNFLVRIPAVRRIGTKFPQPYYAYVRQRDASQGYDATNRLGEIAAPTLILHGEKDKTVPYSLAEEMHQGIRGSRMISFDGGHLFMLRKQKENVESVLDFLTGQNPQSSG